MNKSVTYPVFLLILLQWAVAGTVMADNESLDQLFLGLKDAPDESTAREYEHKIWLRWFESGDSKIDALMEQAVKKRNQYDFNGAIEILNQVIALKPEYAEVWNQRATVYFHQGEYEKSLWDVAKTLELEPRHFASMAGRAVIRLLQGKPALAQQNMLQALEYHPYLKERSFFPHLK
ncbi:MAG: tetratricopeptide repeat protein [Gammaproteobacteria bacterium]|nr:tetratricopeptide repeat protein [Gammaproteobacteria bacterium]